jgi:uncharacterized protein YciI
MLSLTSSTFVRLEKEGLLFAAGPLLDERDRFNGVGLYVLRARSRAHARELADADPFHALALRTYRLQPWQVNEGAFIVKIDYSDGTYRID